MGEKGLMEEDWNDRRNWRKEIIVKWAQEDVETLYSLLNNNNNYIMFYNCSVNTQVRQPNPGVFSSSSGI